MSLFPYKSEMKRYKRENIKKMKKMYIQRRKKEKERKSIREEGKEK